MTVIDTGRGPNEILTCVLGRGTSGLASKRKKCKLGMRASGTVEVSDADCFVPGYQIIGAVWEGFVDALKVLDAGRLARSGCLGGDDEASHDRTGAVRLADRVVSGDPVHDCRHGIRIETSRSLTYRAAHIKGL
jgi:alkylation response protein AidB-like acyl-CoA dehydrogenase